MSATNFIVKEHITLGQHIREDFINSSPNDPAWQIQVKQYTPRNNLGPKEGDITILSSHANAFPKELYEPFWDDLLSVLGTKNLKIRHIFMITHPHLSPTSLNPGLTPDGSRVSDTSRDLLLVVNHFRHSILHPIIGIGHSVGASQLLSLSLMHPSLFTALVPIEPIIVRNGPEGGVEKLALAAIKRRREWKTRTEAEAYFQKAWKNWDVRVRKRWMASALVPCDVDNVQGKTELAWTRIQELDSYMDASELRAFADGVSVNGEKGSAIWTPFAPQIWERIRDVAVHVLFVCGSESNQHGESTRQHWRDFTGTNEKFWPSGFTRSVQLVEMKDLGHLAPFEAPDTCAETAANWIDVEMKGWWEAWKKDRRWRQMSKEDKEQAIEGWMMGLKSRI